MEDKNKQFSSERGSTALLMSVMVLFSTLAIILAISDVIRSRIETNRAQINSTKAYFAAEAGAERILYEVRSGGFAGCSVNDYFNFASDCNSAEVWNPLSNNAQSAVKFTATAPDTKVTCYGKFGDVSRAVELIY